MRITSCPCLIFATMWFARMWFFFDLFLTEVRVLTSAWSGQELLTSVTRTIVTSPICIRHSRTLLKKSLWSSQLRLPQLNIYTIIINKYIFSLSTFKSFHTWRMHTSKSILVFLVPVGALFYVSRAFLVYVCELSCPSMKQKKNQ